MFFMGGTERITYGGCIMFWICFILLQADVYILLWRTLAQHLTLSLFATVVSIYLEGHNPLTESSTSASIILEMVLSSFHRCVVLFFFFFFGGCWLYSGKALYGDSRGVGCLLFAFIEMTVLKSCSFPFQSTVRMVPRGDVLLEAY